MRSHLRYRIKGLRQLVGGWTSAEPSGGATSPEGAVTPPRDPGALSGPLTGISFVAGVAGALSLADSPYPRPGAEPADVRRYFQEDPCAARISVVGQLTSAASLARFTGSVAKLAARSDRGARGLRAAAIAGGGLAAASLAASALLSAALTGARGGRDASAAKLHRLMFAGVLSPLYFVWERAAWFIPAGRFSGLLVSGVAGARLGRRWGRCMRSYRRVPKPVSRRGDNHRRMR